MIKEAFKTSRRRTENLFQLKNFLGVDFNAHESEVKTQRSPDSVNMISGQAGSMDKRLGVKYINAGSGGIAQSFTEVHYIYKYYPYTSGWTYYDKEMLGVLYGTNGKVYLSVQDVFNGTGMVSDFDFNYTGTRLKQFTPSAVGIGTLSDFSLTDTAKKMRFVKISQYVYMMICEEGVPDKYSLDEPEQTTFIIKLTQVSGNSYYGMKMYDLGWEMPVEVEAYIIDINDYLVQAKLSYIPTTAIARNPLGTSSQAYESPSIISQSRINTFASNGTATVYKVDNQILSGKTPIITMLDINGGWTTAVPSFTYNTNGTITFSTAPQVSPILGQDNIKIQFMWYSYLSIKTFKNFGKFGFNGKSDFIFLISRTNDVRNRDYRLELKNDLLYIPENGYTDFGSSDTNIVGYGIYGDEQIIFSSGNGNSSFIFMRSASIDSEGELKFPTRQGITGIGAVNGDTFSSFRDDAIWISNYGVNAIVTNNVTAVQSVQDRGFFINSMIVKNSEYLFSIIHDNKCYIFNGNYCFVADSRYKSSEKLAVSEDFQYEWYLFKFQYIITTAVSIRGRLYLGTPNGIYRFKSETQYSYAIPLDVKPYTDDIIGTETLWANATNYAVNQLVKDSGTPIKYYTCLKAHTSETTLRNLTNETYWNEITKATDRWHVPVICYWTTPIMNMGNMTIRKTLRNLWVRLAKYSFTSVRIYYSTQGIVKKQYDGIFDFSTLDFSRLVFSTDTDPMVLVTNVRESKFMSIQFKIESREDTPMSLLEIVGKYTNNSQYKG